MPKEMTASEALYGFVAWLTTRSDVVTLAANHDAAPVAALVQKFCDANNLTIPREDWTDRLTYPTE